MSNLSNTSAVVAQAPASNGIQTVDVTNDSTRTVTVGEFTRGGSAFYEGRTFKFTGVSKRLILNADEIAKRDEMLASGKTEAEFIATLDPNKRVQVVFTTDLPDTGAVIWLSSYTARKTKLDVSNQPVLRDGSFDKAVYAMLANASDTDDLFALSQTVLAQFVGKTVTVRRKHFSALNRFRKAETVSIPCFDA